MPRIDAPTVAEHRANVQTHLIEAAERLLREGEPLTAGAVAQAAGIARNSVYRYVESIDDLRAMVVARYLPAWVESVEQSLDGIDNPRQRIAIWLRANLEQAQLGGHGWLVETMSAASRTSSDDVERAHRLMRDEISAAWLDLLPPREAGTAAALTYALLEAGFRLLEAGQDLDLVTRAATDAALGMAPAAIGRGDHAEGTDRP